MLETEPDPSPVLLVEQLSVSEYDRLREISFRLGSGHRTDPHESQPWTLGIVPMERGRDF